MSDVTPKLTRMYNKSTNTTNTKEIKFINTLKNIQAISSAYTATNLYNIDTHYKTVNITMGAAILVLTSLNRK